MKRDLKILLWTAIVSLTILTVYSIVDIVFRSLDNPKAQQYFKKYTERYTQEPDKQDPDLKPDKDWRPRREQIPFLGYAHPSVVYILTGILVIAILGFMIMYMISRREKL